MKKHGAHGPARISLPLTFPCGKNPKSRKKGTHCTATQSCIEGDGVPPDKADAFLEFHLCLEAIKRIWTWIYTAIRKRR